MKAELDKFDIQPRDRVVICLRSVNLIAAIYTCLMKGRGRTKNFKIKTFFTVYDGYFRRIMKTYGHENCLRAQN